MKPAESGPVKHTPGPWVVFDKGRTQAVMDSAGRQVVAWPGFDSSDVLDAAERRANLALIANVPDLYRGALLVIHSPPHSDDFDLGMTILCNSIDRTEGRKPTP